MQERAGEQKPAALRVLTLGTFALLRLDEFAYSEVPREEWGSRVASLSLLKLLLCRSDRQASTDLLIEAFWPDKETGKALQSLHAAVSVLRRILRRHTSEQLLLTTAGSDGRGYRLADQKRIWVDADAFEALMQQASRAEHAVRPDEAQQLWEQAYALSEGGTFLPDDLYSDWANERRRALDWDRAQCVHQLVTHYLAEGRESEAERVLRRVLAHPQPANEDTLFLLLSYWEQQQRYRAVYQFYQVTKELFKQDQIPLTPRVKALVRRAHTQLVSEEPTPTITIALPEPAPVVVEAAPRLLLLPPAFTTLVPLELAAADSAIFTAERLVHIITLVQHWSRQMMNCADLQALVDLELHMFDDVQAQYDFEELLLSRRHALIVIAALPKSLLDGVQQRHTPALPPEEFLAPCAASVTACWHLMKGREFATVERAVARYLPLLNTWAKEPSVHQQAVAYLAAQSCLLMELVELHKLHFRERVAYCKQAVEYAREAGDRTLLVTTLTHFSAAYHDVGQLNNMLRANQETMQYIDEVPPLVQSKLLASLARAYACNGQTQEALHCMSKARAILPEVGEVPVFLSNDSGSFLVFLFEGQTRLELGDHDPGSDHYEQATKVLAQIKELPKKIVIPERFRIEVINQQAKAAVKVRNMEEFRSYLIEGVQGAQKLQSEKRMQEAKTVYQEARRVWPHEAQVRGLADLFAMQGVD